mmetsp:Transcript_35742/g.91908  ORF Transcript_35742/g.91908 Transcript_35742/m.91908 type:complete len:214 (+) Transcript_35742:719-1360(+)
MPRGLSHDLQLLVARDGVREHERVPAPELLRQHLRLDDFQQLLRGDAREDVHLGSDGRVQYPFGCGPEHRHHGRRVDEEDLARLLGEVHLDHLRACLQHLQVVQALPHAEAGQVANVRDPADGPPVLLRGLPHATLDHCHVVRVALEPLLDGKHVPAVTAEELAQPLEHQDVALAVPAGIRAYPEAAVDGQRHWRLREDVVHAVVGAPLQRLG